jgi:hypothetical protein
MDLMRINQLSKVGGHPFLFNKSRIFWISDIDYCFDGVNVLRVKVSPKQHIDVSNAFLLTLDSPGKTRYLFQDLISLNELHQDRKLRFKDDCGHCLVTKISIISLRRPIVSPTRVYSESEKESWSTQLC